MSFRGYRISTMILIALISLRCSQTTVVDSTSTCKSATTLGFDAYNPLDKFAVAGGGVVVTFSLDSAKAISGLRLQARVGTGGANVAVSVFPAAKNSALYFNNSPDYTFTTALAATPSDASAGFGGSPVFIDFPVPFEATWLEGEQQWAVAVKVNSGQLTVFEGYVPSTNHIEARYAYTQDGSSWYSNSETGITLGLKVSSPCP